MPASSSGNIDRLCTSCRYRFCLGACRWQGCFAQTRASPLTSHEPWSSPGHLKFSTGVLFFPLRSFFSKQGRLDPAGEEQSRAYMEAGRAAHSRLDSVLRDSNTTISALEWECGACDFKVLVSSSSRQAASAEHFPGQVIQQVSRGVGSGVRSWEMSRSGPAFR